MQFVPMFWKKKLFKMAFELNQLHCAADRERAREREENQQNLFVRLISISWLIWEATVMLSVVFQALFYWKASGYPTVHVNDS